MYTIEQLIEHAKNAIQHAYCNSSKLNAEHMKLEGMTGHKTRHLYNQMCSLIGSTYCEVGTWKGSSFISAMYDNPSCFGYCIDNWSEFGGPREEACQLIKQHLGENACNYKVLDKDCWQIDSSDITNPVDIYLYDGAHTYEDQKRAITYYKQFFAKYVIIMVDDWTCDWADVKPGTLDGIKEAGLKVHFQHEIGLVNTTQHHASGNTFWNGCGIFVCERTDI